MLTQLPLPLLPAGAAEIAPGVGLVTGDSGGGLVSVHGLATFAWDAGDEAGRRLAAVQLTNIEPSTTATPPPRRGTQTGAEVARWVALPGGAAIRASIRVPESARYTVFDSVRRDGSVG